MLEYFPNVLTPDEMEHFLSISDPYKEKRNFQSLPIELSKIDDVVQSVIDINHPQFYFNIECRSQGSRWHYDGCNKEFQQNHMAWCRYSAVLLLSNPKSFKGGEYQYVDKDTTEENPKVLKEDLYGSLLIYSSAYDNNPLLHRATAHTGGERWMFLMFMDGKEKV